MSNAVLHSRAQLGIEAPAVTIEVHLSGGMPGFSVVGLAETAVRESRDRVRAALENAGFKLPVAHITVSLAPADLPKQGGWFDLPIALGILIASDQIRCQRDLDQVEFAAELSLQGQLRPVRGLLPAVAAARQAGRVMLTSVANADEGSLAGSECTLRAARLMDAVAWLGGQQELESGVLARQQQPQEAPPDLIDVIDQPLAKRALEVTAAGGHNMLMVGPPGAGKSMLAQRLPGILPPLRHDQALEVAMIHSVSGQRRLSGGRVAPFYSPHHTASAPALIGGGRIPRPGAASLAHQGVLFLDELPEFDRRTLEALREPLETGEVSIARAEGHATFPARFQLIAAMNPCPCAQSEHCRCSASQIERYRSRLSGPLIDRIDIRLQIPAVSIQALMRPKAKEGENSAVVAQRVQAARQRQWQRCGKLNAWLGAAEVETYCALGKREQGFVQQAVERLGLSARGYHRLLRVARTIADLAGAETITSQHLAEAINYRRYDPGNDRGQSGLRLAASVAPKG